MSADKVCFQRDVVEDYVLQDLFKVTKSHLLDLRVKLLLKEDLILSPYENMFTKTACIIACDELDFSLHILQHEQCPLTLLTEGYISEQFSGSVWVKLAKNSPKIIKLHAGFEVGYILLNTIALK